MLSEGQDFPDDRHAFARVDLGADHDAYDSQNHRVGAVLPMCQCATPSGDVCEHCPNLPPGHPVTVTHAERAGGSLDTGQAMFDAQGGNAGVSSCDGQSSFDIQASRAVAPHDALLLILADSLDDLERVRIATGNRLRALTAVPQNENDSAKGFSNIPEARRLEELLAGLEALEAKATKDLEKVMRTHPLGPWVKRTVGVGMKQAARLLAAIGDPADRPNPAKLWQYAGHGDPARSKLRRGQPVEHNPTAKMRVHLIAESCIKQMHSPYRAVYDRERAKWAERDTTDGHKHNHALRVVGKAMLLDLWREARDLRGDQSKIGDHGGYVPADLPPAMEVTTSICSAPVAELEENGHDQSKAAA